jgi:hypothetical protein
MLADLLSGDLTIAHIGGNPVRQRTSVGRLGGYQTLGTQKFNVLATSDWSCSCIPGFGRYATMTASHIGFSATYGTIARNTNTANSTR